MSHKKESPKPMGVGKLARPSLVFARKFRFTFGSKSLPEDFMSQVEIDYVKKEISFKYLNVMDFENEGAFHALKWAYAKDQDEQFDLTTYDGCGVKLYSIYFDGIEVVEHRASYDYESSDVACESFRIKFKDYYFECHSPHLLADGSTKIPAPASESGTATALLHDLHVEETKVSFLNGSVCLPGKVTVKKGHKNDSGTSAPM